MKDFNIGDTYLWVNQIPVGSSSDLLNFNKFKILDITSKNVYINGTYPSKIRTVKKISITDFKEYKEKFKKV